MNQPPELNIEERLCEYLKMNYRGATIGFRANSLKPFFMSKGQKSGEWSIHFDAKENRFAVITMATTMQQISWKSMRPLPS